jgi:acetyl esterase
MAGLPVENPVPVQETVNTSISGPGGDLRLRIYHPPEVDTPPLLMFFHGGGFVLCNLDSHDDLCRRLCIGIGAVVVSVDYRLAPEAPFPAAPEDCYAATCWAAKNASNIGADASRICVAGDSAGGNLATVVAMMSRDRGGPEIVHQILIYPVTNCAFNTQSYIDNASGYYLTREMMQWFWQHYLASEDQKDHPLASPLQGNVTNLPSATVITAEYDPLRDEGKAYSELMESKGIDVTYKAFEGMIHGFVSMSSGISKANLAIEHICSHAKVKLG